MNCDIKIISIIIPTKNEEKRLPVCLDFIYKLKYNIEEVEIIVVDNGSKDQTVEIAKKYGCKVFIRPEDNISGLRNYGVSLARGEIIAFLDADCFPGEMWLKNGIYFLEQNEDVACVTGMINIPVNATWVERTWSLNRVNKYEIYDKRWASSMNMILKKQIFNSVNGFNETIITGEDVDLCSRIRSNGFRILFVKNVSITHIGEAKTLRELFKKERWRGRSGIDLFIDNIFDVNNILNMSQLILFVFFAVMTTYCFIQRSYLYSIYSLFGVLSFPLARAINISVKNKSFIFMPQLLVIWMLYYVARSFSIYDGIRHKITMVFRNR